MKAISIVISLVIVTVLVAVALISKNSPQGTNKPVTNTTEVSNVKIEDSKQVIYVTSTTGGYSPRKINAKANIKTVLKIESQNSYGCERSFRIPKLNINQILPTEGTTEFELGTPKQGDKLLGTCSMGMYTFTITFN